MKWLLGAKRLAQLGILGMNRRNNECILDLNPRSAFPVVDAKLKMDQLCRSIGVPTPAIYGVLASHSCLHRLPEMVANLNDFVLKPNRGAGGRGILVVTGRDGKFFLRHNGQRMLLDDLRQHVSDVISGLYSLGGRMDEVLIQQRVLLHPAFERISHQGIGDVRIILYRTVPVMAMLRLPTKQSGGRANLHQGGIGAGVDLVTGLTTHAVMRNRVAQHHPDTGHSVLDFQVPRWPEILDMAKKVGKALGLGYIGVDIVMDRDRGALLLEANARPGLAIQIANGCGLWPRLREIDEMLRDRPRTRRSPACPGIAHRDAIRAAALVLQVNGRMAVSKKKHRI
jgi:alpha-L-glutamate ligase-like protein